MVLREFPGWETQLRKDTVKRNTSTFIIIIHSTSRWFHVIWYLKTHSRGLSYYMIILFSGINYQGMIQYVLKDILRLWISSIKICLRSRYKKRSLWCGLSYYRLVGIKVFIILLSIRFYRKDLVTLANRPTEMDAETVIKFYKPGCAPNDSISRSWSYNMLWLSFKALQCVTLAHLYPFPQSSVLWFIGLNVLES